MAKRLDKEISPPPIPPLVPNLRLQGIPTLPRAANVQAALPTPKVLGEVGRDIESVVRNLARPYLNDPVKAIPVVRTLQALGEGAGMVGRAIEDIGRIPVGPLKKPLSKVVGQEIEDITRGGLDIGKKALEAAGHTVPGRIIKAQFETAAKVAEIPVGYKQFIGGKFRQKTVGEHAAEFAEGALRVLNAGGSSLDVVTLHADLIIPDVPAKIQAGDIGARGSQGRIYDRYEKYLKEGMPPDKAANQAMRDYGEALAQLAELQEAGVGARVGAQAARAIGLVQSITAPAPVPGGAALPLVAGVLGRVKIGKELVEELVKAGYKNFDEFSDAASRGAIPDDVMAKLHGPLKDIAERGKQIAAGAAVAPTKKDGTKLAQSIASRQAAKAANPNVSQADKIKAQEVLADAQGKLPARGAALLPKGKGKARPALTAKEAQKQFGQIEGVQVVKPITAAAAKVAAKEAATAKSKVLAQLDEAVKANNLKDAEKITDDLVANHNMNPRQIADRLHRKGVLELTPEELNANAAARLAQEARGATAVGLPRQAVKASSNKGPRDAMKKIERAAGVPAKAKVALKVKAVPKAKAVKAADYTKFVAGLSARGAAIVKADLTNNLVKSLDKGDTKTAKELLGKLHAHNVTDADLAKSGIDVTKLPGGPPSRGGGLPTAIATPPPPGNSITSRLDRALSYWNAPRALVASLDNSFGFRQGIYFLPNRPAAWAKSEAAAFKAWVSQESADETHRAITKSRWFQTMLDSKVEFTRYDGAYDDILVSRTGLSGREEAFQTDLIGKLPGFRNSSRAYATAGNTLRAQVFEDAAQVWEKAGIKATDVDYKALASYINYATGRGSLGNLERYAPLLNGMFFAPKYFVSRLQLAASPWVLRQSPLVRKMAAQELLKFVGTGGILLGALKAAFKANKADADIELDPRSSDFGKVRIGARRYEFWGGFQPIARYTAQFLTGQKKTLQGDIIPAERGEVVGGFVRSKLQPITGTAWDLAQGRDFIGNPLTVTELVGGTILPISPLDIVESAQVEARNGGNALVGAALGLPALLGVGVQVHQDEPGETRRAFDPLNETGRLPPPGGEIDLGPGGIRVGGPEQILRGPVQGIRELQGPLPVDPVEAELRRLKQPGKISPAGVPLSEFAFKVKFTPLDSSEKLQVNDEDNRKYLESSGKIVYEELSRLFADKTPVKFAGQRQAKLYSQMTNDEKRKAIERRTTEGKEAAKQIMALNIIKTGATIERRIHGVNIAMSSADDNLEKATALSNIQRAGDLRPDIIAKFDANKEHGLTVAEFLRGKELVEQYNNAPAFRIGNQAAWNAAKIASDQLKELRKGKSAEAIKRDPNIKKFYSTAAKGWLRVLYESDGSTKQKYVHRTRQLIKQEELWSKFSQFGN